MRFPYIACVLYVVKDRCMEMHFPGVPFILAIVPIDAWQGDGCSNPVRFRPSKERQCWVIPPKANSAFVAAMEDVLAVYTRPHNADYPLVCLDESLEATHCRDAHANPDETRTCSPHRLRVRAQRHRQPVHAVRAARRGRHVEVTDRHTAVDYAHVLKDLADRHFPHTKTIVLVQDNLNIHSKASLYEAFPAAEARRLVERFNGTTRLSTAVGSISRNPNSVSSPLSVSIAASQTNRPHRGNRRLGTLPKCQSHKGRLAILRPNPLEFKLKYLYPSI